MKCPAEIADILLEILKTGIVRLRNVGGQAPQRITIEADHLHNLPGLLMDFSPELLRFYWDVERTTFIDQSSAEDLLGFQPCWARLERFVPKGEALAARN